MKSAQVERVVQTVTLPVARQDDGDGDGDARGRADECGCDATWEVDTAPSPTCRVCAQC